MKERFRDSLVLAPDHWALESARALQKYVRAGIFDSKYAHAVLADLLNLRVQLVPTERLAPRALEVGLAAGLTVYDAAYVVVAVAAGAPLVTADRRLAAAYERSELIS